MFNWWTGHYHQFLTCSFIFYFFLNTFIYERSNSFYWALLIVKKKTKKKLTDLQNVLLSFFDHPPGSEWRVLAIVFYLTSASWFRPLSDQCPLRWGHLRFCLADLFFWGFQVPRKEALWQVRFHVLCELTWLIGCLSL